MAVALKDFQYFDHARKESVQIRAGDGVDNLSDRLDLSKLGRTKYVDLEAKGSEMIRESAKRARKRKGN